ncbi:hypothetical protein DsansV1_C14g0129781 [Dioscorea sansibarensis]
MSFPLRAHFSCCQLCLPTISFLRFLSFFLSFSFCVYVYVFLSTYVFKDERYKAITDGKGHGVAPFEENQRPTRVQPAFRSEELETSSKARKSQAFEMVHGWF